MIRHLQRIRRADDHLQIAQTSSILVDFSRRYGDRLHQTARSGTPVGSLPGMIEVNDMIQKSRSQVEALLKNRAVVLTHQAAYDQHLADQRPTKTIPEPVLDDSEQLAETDESKVGFAGSDTKKRHPNGDVDPTVPGLCATPVACIMQSSPENNKAPTKVPVLAARICGPRRLRETGPHTNWSQFYKHSALFFLPVLRYPKCALPY